MTVNRKILQALKESVALNESSLSRVLSHIKTRCFCLITAFRAKDDKGEPISREDNIKSNKKLAYTLINSHWGFFRVNGKFVQTDHNDGKPVWVKEDSYFVIGPKYDNTEACEDFISEMVMLGREYKQQSIILGTPEGVFEYDKFGKKLSTFKKDPTTITNKDAESYMTQLIGRGERAFKFEIGDVKAEKLD